MYSDGILVANAEFGHLVIGGAEAEEFASGHARAGEDRPGRTGPIMWSSSSESSNGLYGLTSAIAAALGNDAGVVSAALAGEAR